MVQLTPDPHFQTIAALDSDCDESSHGKDAFLEKRSLDNGPRAVSALKKHACSRADPLIETWAMCTLLTCKLTWKLGGYLDTQ